MGISKDLAIRRRLQRGQRVLKPWVVKSRARLLPWRRLSRPGGARARLLPWLRLFRPGVARKRRSRASRALLRRARGSARFVLLRPAVVGDIVALLSSTVLARDGRRIRSIAR
jgi:hypothetical protein